MALNKVEMVRQALLELGEATSQQLATFIEEQHGVRIEARFIPILRASVRGQEVLEQARQAARTALQAAEKASDDAGSARATETVATST